jgi:hypothetical protein
MGGSSSKTEVTSTMDLTTDVVIKNIQNATTDLSASQNFNLYVDQGATANIGCVKQSQEVDINVINKFTNNDTTKLQNDITNAVNAQATAIGQIISLSNNSADNVQKFNNTVKTSITKENLQNCASTITANQNINWRVGTGGTLNQNGSACVEQKQIVSLVKQCLSSNTTLNDAATKLDQSITADAKAHTENPLDFIAKSLNSIFGGLQGGNMLSGICCVICMIIVLVGLFKMMQSSGQSGGSNNIDIFGKLVNNTMY